MHILVRSGQQTPDLTNLSEKPLVLLFLILKICKYCIWGGMMYYVYFTWIKVKKNTDSKVCRTRNLLGSQFAQGKLKKKTFCVLK